MVRKPRRAEKRARGNRASRAAEDAYRAGQAGGVGGGERGGPREAIEAGSEWGARQRGDATEAGRGDRGGPGAGLGEGPRSELVEGRDLVSELDGPNVSEVARGCDLQTRAV